MCDRLYTYYVTFAQHLPSPLAPLQNARFSHPLALRSYPERATERSVPFFMCMLTHCTTNHYCPPIGVDLKTSPTYAAQNNSLFEILVQEHWRRVIVLHVASDLPENSETKRKSRQLFVRQIS